MIKSLAFIDQSLHFKKYRIYSITVVDAHRSTKYLIIILEVLEVQWLGRRQTVFSCLFYNNSSILEVAPYFVTINTKFKVVT